MPAGSGQPPNVYGQTPAGITAPVNPGSGNLPGSTYEGSFSNSLASIPVLGGSINSLLTSLYGSKPATADPTSTALDAIIGNDQNLNSKQLQNLTLGTDQLTAEGAALPFQENLPGYESALNTASGNTQAELEGQIPQDVINQITQAGAERGIATGQGSGSPNDNASYLQALGLTSQNEMGIGQSNLSQLIGETPTGQPFNPSSMYVTPAQQQSAQQYANTIAAAPDPEASGLMNTIMGFL